MEVEEYYALVDPVAVKGNWFEGQSQVWAERLKLLGASSTQVIAAYGNSNGWLDGRPAITVNASGRGLVYYAGAYLDPSAQQSFMDRVIKNADLKPVHTPAGVELVSRVRPGGEEIYFAINHQPEPKTVSFPWSLKNVLAEEPASAELKLPAYGVAVLVRRK